MPARASSTFGRDDVVEAIVYGPDERWQDWTSCEMYGHEFNDEGWCECGERRAED